MKSYITQVSVINKNSFDDRAFSLSGKDYRKLEVSTNSKTLSSLIQNSYQGKEIGSASYMKRSKYRFIKTVNLTNNFGISENLMQLLSFIYGAAPFFKILLFPIWPLGQG